MRVTPSVPRERPPNSILSIRRQVPENSISSATSAMIRAAVHGCVKYSSRAVACGYTCLFIGMQIPVDSVCITSLQLWKSIKICLSLGIRSAIVIKQMNIN
jgi:hypothetical protein